jgi:arginine exporter protein ArgO
MYLDRAMIALGGAATACLLAAILGFKQDYPPWASFAMNACFYLSLSLGAVSLFRLFFKERTWALIALISAIFLVSCSSWVIEGGDPQPIPYQTTTK